MVKKAEAEAKAEAPAQLKLEARARAKAPPSNKPPVTWKPKIQPTPAPAQAQSVSKKPEILLKRFAAAETVRKAKEEAEKAVIEAKAEEMYRETKLAAEAEAAAKIEKMIYEKTKRSKNKEGKRIDASGRGTNGSEHLLGNAALSNAATSENFGKPKFDIKALEDQSARVGNALDKKKPSSPSFRKQLSSSQSQKKCEGLAEADANKIVNNYITKIIPANKNKDKEGIELLRLQLENKEIYEQCHKDITRDKGHLMNIRKMDIVQAYHKLYINDYLAKKNLERAVEKITKDGVAKWEQKEQAKINRGKPKEEIKKAKKDHDKVIDEEVKFANKQTQQYYSHNYPDFGWDKLDTNKKLKRIVTFFELTFKYTNQEAIKQATTFRSDWHSDTSNPDPMTTFVGSSSRDKETFAEIWSSGKMPNPRRFKGGRKTKKKRKKNASPIKTRKVKKKK
jgi:hypothetical protein